MTTYYFETENGSGKYEAENDQIAIDKAREIKNLLVMYRESNSADGTPLVILVENSR
jgi:hypothetical protein